MTEPSTSGTSSAAASRRASTSTSPQYSSAAFSGDVGHEVLHETEHEFGKSKQTIKPVDHELSSEEELAVPVDVLMSSQDASSDGKKPATKYHLLLRRLMRPRWLRQYFLDGHLIREMKPRKVGEDELFLDLIIVANVAVLGHELRESAIAWSDVQKFIVLFGVIWSSWRNFAFLWNSFSSHSDVFEKVFVCLEMFALSGVGVSAHGAFTSAKNYAAVFATFSLLIPAIAHIYFSMKEPVMKGANNIMNAGVFGGLVTAICALVYLFALPVSKGNITGLAAVYWTGLVLNIFGTGVAAMTFRRLHKRRASALHIAVNIEVIVEKNALLTLIVLGEALLAILFEGADIIREDASLGLLYFSAFLGVVITYSFMTLYFHVDNLILRGGLHSIRYKPIRGYIWSITHFFHQMGLIFAATGIGQALRTVALGNAGGEAAEGASGHLSMIGRASAESSGDAALVRTEFTTSHAWLFGVGFAVVLLSSALLGALHKAGPRAATKWFRLPARVVVTLIVSIGLPLWNGLSTIAFESIFAGVVAAIMLVELILVEMDRMGWWKYEDHPSWSQYSSDNLKDSVDFFDGLDDGNIEDQQQADDEAAGQTPRSSHRRRKSVLPEIEIPEERARSGDHQNNTKKAVTFAPTEPSADEDKGTATQDPNNGDRVSQQELEGGQPQVRSGNMGVTTVARNGSKGISRHPERRTRLCKCRRSVSLFPPSILEHLHHDTPTGDLEEGRTGLRRVRTCITRRIGGERRRFETLCQGDKGAASCTINH